MPNLIEYWGNLTQTDKEVIIKALRVTPRYATTPLGIMPLIDVRAIIESLVLLREHIEVAFGKNGVRPNQALLKFDLSQIDTVLDKLPKDLPPPERVVWLKDGSPADSDP